MSGVVFNIQHYSLHDGLGIRTVVFLKGCPLRCAWCSNPESQEFSPQVYFDKSKCISEKGCELCKNFYDSKNSKGCKLTADIEKNYIDVCPSKALNIYGKIITAKQVVDEAESESAFYAHGGGGITLSGGEPFSQGEFAIEILKEAKLRRMNTAVETCGYCDSKILAEAGKYLDYIMYDIKCIDPKKHKIFTGMDNSLILENAKMLFEKFPDTKIKIRTPVIPSFNDNEEDIREIKKFISSRKNVEHELLEYHRFGTGKYKMLGREYADLPEKLDKDLFEKLKTV